MPLETVYIISLKFAPGLKKEFMVLGGNVYKKGGHIKYIISDAYSKLQGKDEQVEYIPTKDGIKGISLDTLKFINGKRFLNILSSAPPLFVCFYNPHPLNPVISRLIRKNFPQTQLALYLHDPYKPDKRPYGAAKGAYILAVEFIQGRTIQYMDYVISPSEYSSQLFRKRYPRFKGKNYIAPLLVPDQGVSVETRRKYFSIVGSAHTATGHDTFVELVNYAASKRLDYNFALISSGNLSNYLGHLDANANKLLKIINKRIILDSEINEVVRESYAVFRLDKEVTQSGVVPVAYMNETPIIARRIPGLSQHVLHEKSGYVVPSECSSKDLVAAMDYVQDNFTELSRNARQSYEEIWAEWNFDKYYGWLIELL